MCMFCDMKGLIPLCHNPEVAEQLEIGIDHAGRVLNELVEMVRGLVKAGVSLNTAQLQTVSKALMMLEDKVQSQGVAIVDSA